MCRAPFGSAVVPDVYRIQRHSSPGSDAGVNVAESPSGSPVDTSRSVRPGTSDAMPSAIAW